MNFVLASRVSILHILIKDTYVEWPSFARDKQNRRCSFGKSAPKNFAKFTVKHLCQSLLFNQVAHLKPATLIKKRLAQVFSCEFFTEQLRTTASG